MADDWTRISASAVVQRALQRIEARGRGILLLHDIQPATALGLPTLLHELKARGYKIVHVVQADSAHPKTATLPEQWQARRGARTAVASFWPQVHFASLTTSQPVLSAPAIQSFGIVSASGAFEPGVAEHDQLRAGDHDIPLPPRALWQRGARIVGIASAATLPAPDASNFRYTRVWKPHQTLVRHRLGTRKRTLTSTAHKNTSSKNASSKNAPAKGAAGQAPKHNTTPRPPRPIGHQIQLPKPTASLPAQTTWR
jgi:hypothetical protein